MQRYLRRIHILLPSLLVLVLLCACGGGETPVPSPTAEGVGEVQGASASPVQTVTATLPPEPSPTAPEARSTTVSVEEPEATAPPDEDEAVEAESVEEEASPEVTEVAVPDAETPVSAAESNPPFDPSAVTVELRPIASGFAAPVGVVSANDGSGRLFVVEKGGRIRIVQEGSALPTPFLDISGKVSTGSEQGLLGLAFEPGRPERFYINYTDTNGDTIIVRYRVSSEANLAEAGSEEVILRLEQPAANHNGGHLLFGPDGYLWIGMGDGGAAGDRFQNGQNTNTLLGAMLRLDVSGESGYTVPADNPFVNGGGAPEIWAYGLRNPWRYSFDRETGDLWLADVGQNQWEEVNHTPGDAPGLNYGWPILEASHCFIQSPCDTEGLVLPVTEYGRDQGISVTGGYVYRGEQFPALRGGYFFSDYGSGLLWAIPATTEELIAPTVVLDTGLSVSSFGEDEAGELYLTDIAGGGLYQIARP